MFRHYQKTYRVQIPQFNIPGKHVLSKKDVKRLLGAEVEITEKMDGANTGIIRHRKGFTLQKKGSLVGQSEHEQFGFFHNWANVQNYDKIMELPRNHILYGELMFLVHTIYYDKLPDYFLVFDIWTGNKYLATEKKIEFCKKYGFCHVPIITTGYFNVNELAALIPGPSAYGETAEGISIKRYRKKDYLRGKIVKPEFIKAMEEDLHWTRGPQKRNKRG